MTTPPPSAAPPPDGTPPDGTPPDGTPENGTPQNGSPPAPTTQGTLLGGRVHYTQPSDGYRTGLEPVLLAAAIPARPGQRVLEAGTGAGAGLLCLAARVPGIHGTGIERDPAQAALACANSLANGFATLDILTADITAWRTENRFDHAFANPPWHDRAGTGSPNPGRLAAKRAAPGLLADWAAALASMLRPRGSLTLILPAAHLAEATAALVAAGCPEIRLIPLWPRQGVAAKLLIIQGIHGGRSACTLSAGLTLHEADGRFTAAADAILRLGAGLPLSAFETNRR